MMRIECLFAFDLIDCNNTRIKMYSLEVRMSICCQNFNACCYSCHSFLTTWFKSRRGYRVEPTSDCFEVVRGQSCTPTLFLSHSDRNKGDLIT